MRETLTDEGFAVVPGVLRLEEISRLANELGDSPMPRSRAGVRHALGQPRIRQLSGDARLLDLAREVLGNRAFPYRVTLFDKSPEANWLVVWRQDTALPLQKRSNTPGWGPWSVKDGVTYAHAPASALSQVLALRVHLDDSNIDNGPLRVLPGTHTLGVLTDEAIHELSSAIPPVDCLAGPGGVVAMRPLLVHASSKSRSQTRRRVLHIEYAAQTVFEEGLALAST